MIEVFGSVSRSFVFPARLGHALDYYRDFNRVVHHLSMISIVNSLGDDKYRVMYQSVELGVYQIKIYCDVQILVDDEEKLLIVQTIDDQPKMPARSGWHSSEAHGAFASQSLFYADGEHTRIEYKLHLRASVPAPAGLRLVPAEVLNQMAGSITAWRMDTIVDRFVGESVRDFRNGVV